MDNGNDLIINLWLAIFHIEWHRFFQRFTSDSKEFTHNINYKLDISFNHAMMFK